LYSLYFPSTSMRCYYFISDVCDKTTLSIYMFMFKYYDKESLCIQSVEVDMITIQLEIKHGFNSIESIWLSGLDLISFDCKSLLSITANQIILYTHITITSDNIIQCNHCSTLEIYLITFYQLWNFVFFMR